MPATDLEKLVIQIEANTNKLSKDMAKVQRDMNGAMNNVERRTEQMNQRVTASFAKAGQSVRRLGATLFTGAALIGIERFVSKIADAVSKIQDASEALGVSTDTLQGFTVMAGRAGVEQDQLTGSLEQFTKRLGEAQLKGGEFAKLLDGIGVGTHGTPEEVLLRLADAVQKTGNAQQRVAIVTEALGKNAAALTPILAQGSTAFKAQIEDLKRLGFIVLPENIKKIDELGDKWKDLKTKLTVVGANVLSGFSDSFSKFADELSSPEFQASLKEFGHVMGEVAVIAAKLAPILPNLLGAAAAARLTPGPPIAKAIAAVAGFALAEEFKSDTRSVEELEAAVKRLKDTLTALNSISMDEGTALVLANTAAELKTVEKALESARKARTAAAEALPFAPKGFAPAGGGIDRSGALGKQEEPLSLTQQLDKAVDIGPEMKALSEAFQKVFDADREFREKQFEHGVEIREQVVADVQELNDQEKADLAQFHADMEAAWDGFYERQAEKRQADADDAAEKAQHETEDRLNAASDFFGNLATLSRSSNTTLAGIGKAAAIAQATIDGILAVQKALASAPPPLNFALAASVGVATAVNVAKIAAMEKGGVIGPDGAMKLRRYATGGIASSPQMALFGEGSRPEAFVPLPDGRRIPVSLEMPKIPAGMGGQPQNFFHMPIDARGAQAGVAEQIEAKLRAAAPLIVGASVAVMNKRLPDMMKKATSRKL